MKKLLLLLLLPLCFAFCACGGVDGGKGDEPEAGKFYTVTEAYEKGYLTREDVMSIAYYHNGGIAHNEEIMGEDYSPLPLTPKTLTSETDFAIKDSFYNSDIWKQYENSCTKDDIGYTYYGTYGNVIVVRILVIGEGVDDAEGEENIDGVIIYYSNGLRLSVWINNN